MSEENDFKMLTGKRTLTKEDFDAAKKGDSIFVMRKRDFEKLQTELAQLKEKCAEYEKVLKSIDTDTEIDEQGREWRMDKDDMRIISRNVLEKWKGKG